MIRLYSNCDEIPKWNFDKINETQDYKYLVYGYDGWGDVNVPKNAKEVFESIMEEFSELTVSNKTWRYFELVKDVNDLDNRAYFGKMLLNQLAKRRLSMPKDIRDQYAEQLREFGFYLNDGKPFIKEYERLQKQLKVVYMKLEQKSKEAQEFEGKNFTNNEEISTIKLKVKIQKILKVDLDLKRISVKEWLIWLDEAMNTKAA